MRRLVFFLVDKRVVVVVVVSMLYTFVSRLCSSYTDVNVLTRRCRIPSTSLVFYLSASKTVYPPPELVFSALTITPLHKVKGTFSALYCPSFDCVDASVLCFVSIGLYSCLFAH